MPSSAVLAFEAALQRGSSNTPEMSPLSATGHFESLIKARKKSAKAAAAPAPEAAPAAAPLPEEPTGSLGRGTGVKKDDFAHNHPHLVHGGTFKLLPIQSGGKTIHQPIGPGHAMYDHESMQDADVYKVHNPLESIARIGYRMSQTLKPGDSKGYENPNSKHHGAYLFNQISREMHPMSSRNLAHRQKRARGVHPHVTIRNITSGNWSADNQYAQGKDAPLNLGETLDRIWDPSHSQGSRHATNMSTDVTRGEHITRSFNRIFDVARSLGKDFHGDMDLDHFRGEVRKRRLMGYSGRREMQGLHPEHLGSKHNPADAADFDAKGKPTWKPNPFYGRKKGTPHPMASDLGEEEANKLDNHVDMANHLTSRPIGHGNRERKANRRLVSHYLPKEVQTKNIFDTHTKLRQSPIAQDNS